MCLAWDFLASKLQGKRQLARPRRMCVCERNVKLFLKDRGYEGVNWQDEYKGRILLSAIIQL